MKRNITIGLIITLLAAGLLFVSCDLNHNIGETGTSLGSVDMDGDGKSDGTAIDVDGDEKADGVDTDGDGVIDEAWSDDYKIIEGNVSEPDTTPPAEVSRVSVSEFGGSQITVGWTDPGDSDLSKIIVTYGDSFKSIGKGVESATFDVASDATSFDFTLKAVDTSGNASSVVSSETFSFSYIPADLMPVFFITSSNIGSLNSEMNSAIEAETAKYYILQEDIDMTGITWTPIGTGYTTNKFTGIFNGNGHKLSNLVIDGTSNTIGFVGFFGYIGQNGRVMNLGLVDCDVTGKSAELSYTGALNGVIDKGTITGCYSSGTVKNGYGVGGLIGKSSDSEISSCYSECTVTGSSNVNSTAGGLIGEADGGTCENSYAVGNVTAVYYAGGFSGSIVNSNKCSYCYSSGSASKNGTDSSTAAGGFAAFISYSSVNTDCYYDSTQNAPTENTTTDVKAIADLTVQGNFTGFDFSSIWSIDSSISINNGMPYLTGMQP